MNDQRGSGLAFAPGNVSVGILSITGRHSLSPHSFTRNADSVPCGSPAIFFFGQHDGLTLFRMNFCAVRTLPLRRRLIVHDGRVFNDHSEPLTILVQAYQHLWLVKAHDVYQKFTYVSRTRTSLAPLRLSAGRFHFASRLSVPIFRRLRCPQSFTPSRYQPRMSE